MSDSSADSHSERKGSSSYATWNEYIHHADEQGRAGPRDRRVRPATVKALDRKPFKQMWMRLNGEVSAMRAEAAYGNRCQYHRVEPFRRPTQRKCLRASGR